MQMYANVSLRRRIRPSGKMSWAVEEWKDGLPAKALQKIQEIEVQLDKLKKERQQKQFQMDSLEATLQKQRQKMDSEKNEASALKRENQSLVESCEHLEKTRQKLIHDIHTKEQQVNYLEGQLNSSKKQMDRLEQEVKKYKHELERSQTSHSSEMQQFSTPQKTFAAPPTPDHWQQDLKISELQEKYNREVEERKRLEAEIKVMHVKLLNQSAMSHKDIARQQTGSSIFPWQQEQKHSHQSLPVIETPSRRRNGPSGMSWSFDDTPIKPHQQISNAQSETTGLQQMEQLKNLNQDLRSKISELELRLQTQDKDLKSQINRFNEIQSQLDLAKKDLVEKEKLLNKSRDDLTKATSQYEQSVSKCLGVEIKLKQVTEEMNCQRHNSESVHRSLEQKIKDQERESQKELAHVQSSHQALDQQFNQMKTKTSMELQQAKKDYNVLQSEMDKVTALKNKLDKDLEELRQKLLRSEQALQASQVKEGELKKKFEEMQREKNTLSCQLDQGMKRVKQLEDEKQNNDQNLAKSRMMVDDLRIKTQSQSEELMELSKKMDRHSVLSAQELETSKKSLAEMEMKNVKMQAELQKNAQEVELKSNKISSLDKENEELKKTSNLLQKEYAEMKKGYEAIQEWKTEKEELINNNDSNREKMLSTISDLERQKSNLSNSHEELKKSIEHLESEKTCLSTQIDSLKGELLVKCVELEEKGKANEELKKQLSEEKLKYNENMENLKQQMGEQVKGLEAKLLKETSKVEAMEQEHGQLLAEYESACIMAKSKDSLIELNKTEIERIQQSLLMQELELEKLKEDKDVLDELEKTSLLEADLKSQKDFTADIQGKYDELSKVKDDLMEKVSLVEKREKDLIDEIECLVQKNNFFCSLEDQFNLLVTEAEETRVSLEQLKELQVQTANDFKNQKATAENLAKDVAEERKRATDFELENKQLREKDHEIEKLVNDLSEKNQSLAKLYEGLCKENENHLCMMNEALSEKATMAEKIALFQTELEASNCSSASLKEALESLQKQLDSSADLNLNLGKELQEVSEEKASLEKIINELKEKLVKDSEAYVSEQEAHLKQQNGLEKRTSLLEEQLQSKVLEARDVMEKLEVVTNEMMTSKQDLELSENKLKEVNDTLQKAVKELEDLKESAIHNEELECLKTALEQMKSKEATQTCEIESLKENLQAVHLEHAKTLETLNDKNMNMSKIKVQLEMLQMDLEDNEICINSFDAQTEELQSNITVLEANLRESEAQKSILRAKLDSVTEEFSKCSQEVLQLSASLEEAQKEQQCSALEAEIQSLRGAYELLKVALEDENCKRVNLETMYNSIVEQKHKLECDVKELIAGTKNYQEQMDQLKQENDCLVTEIAEQKNNFEKYYSKTLVCKSDVFTANQERMGDEDQEICEMAFANTSILPFEEDTSIVVMSSPKAKFDLLEPLSSEDDDLNKSSKTEDALHVLKIKEEEQTHAEVEQLKLEHAKELQILEEQMARVKHELEAELREEREHTETLSSQLATIQHLQEFKCPSPSLETGVTQQENENITTEATENISQLQDLSDSTQSGAPVKETLHKEFESLKEIVQKQEEKLLHWRSKFEVLESEMAIRKEMYSDLEGKLHEIDTERTNGTEKLLLANQENKKLNNHIGGLTEEIDSLNLQLQTSKCQLSDVLEMMETLEVAKGEWNEKFFQIESELKRVRSEKANLEKHILSMETDIDEMQEQKQKLEEELEMARRTSCCLEQQLSKTIEEGGRLKEELNLCIDEKESESQSLSKWKEKAELLERREISTKELIKELEEDIRTEKRQNDAMSHQINLLLKEKQELLQQYQNLESKVSLLTQDNNRLLNEYNDLKNDSFASRESENMSSKINSLEEENIRLSQSLELSLLEKGEIASRLISTQEEVAQMRQGIEKLKVRIESDERKKNHMTQLLKDAQRKADALQDNIEKLEREKELLEPTLEDAVLQAETAKAELEEIQAEMKGLSKEICDMTSELTNLKEEKSKLEQELLQKNSIIQELELAKQETSEKLKSVEQVTVNQQQVIKDCQLKFSAVEEKLQLCQTDVELKELRAQELASRLLSLESENKDFSQSILEYERSQAELRSTNQSLLNNLENSQQEFSELQSQIAALRSNNEERVKCCVALQSTVTQLEEKIQMQSTEIEVMLNNVTSLENCTNQLESQLAEVKLKNMGLTEKLTLVMESSVQLKTQHHQELSEAKEKQNALEAKHNLLACRLQESQTQLENKDVQLKENNMRYEENIKNTQQQNGVELNALKEEVIAANKKSVQLLSELTSVKSQNVELESTLTQLQNKVESSEKEKEELNSKVLHLSKEKDSVASKINLWIKSCKQLESENQVLQDELYKQGQEIEALKASKNKVDGGSSSNESLQKEIQDLKEALELKSNEADDSMDRYCSLIVKVHKLEKANESLMDQLNLLSPQTRVPKIRRSLRSDKNDLENTKPVEDCIVAGKRQRVAEDTPNKAQEALHSITKRLKAAAATPKATQDDEDFRPEGLPELVQRDIPVGEMSPFIMRRTTVQRCSPRLAARLCSGSPQQLVQVSKQTQEGRTANTSHSTVLSPHSASLSTELKTRRRSQVFRKSPEKPEQVCNSPKQNDNCQVQ
ncbi:hypothetical protein DNTS_016692 [Danionella cerebrum]|uniref:Centromere protein F n=1 Tax=Danionella cerebrum TaxID=2873325 RepID=A0A553QED5_9TELE|nr:hypothetical protein DNTS_016692 [Danionella translucida]